MGVTPGQCWESDGLLLTERMFVSSVMGMSASHDAIEGDSGIGSTGKGYTKGSVSFKFEGGHHFCPLCDRESYCVSCSGSNMGATIHADDEDSGLGVDRKKRYDKEQYFEARVHRRK